MQKSTFDFFWQFLATFGKHDGLAKNMTQTICDKMLPFMFWYLKRFGIHKWRHWLCITAYRNSSYLDWFFDTYLGNYMVQTFKQLTYQLIFSSRSMPIWIFVFKAYLCCHYNSQPGIQIKYFNSSSTIWLWWICQTICWEIFNEFMSKCKKMSKSFSWWSQSWC